MHNISQWQNALGDRQQHSTVEYRPRATDDRGDRARARVHCAVLERRVRSGAM